MGFEAANGGHQSNRFYGARKRNSNNRKRQRHFTDCESSVMNLQMHQELDSLIAPVGASLAPAVARTILAKSLVNIIVINIISNNLLSGNSG